MSAIKVFEMYKERMFLWLSNSFHMSPNDLDIGLSKGSKTKKMHQIYIDMLAPGYPIAAPVGRKH